MKETPLTKTNKFPPQRQAISVIGSMIAKQKLIPTPRKSAWPKVRRMPSFPKAARSTMVRRTSQKEREKKENQVDFYLMQNALYYQYTTIESDAVRLPSSGGKNGNQYWQVAGSLSSLYNLTQLLSVCVSTIYCTCHGPDHLSSTFY